MCSDRVHLLQVLNIPHLQTRIMERFRWEKPSKISGPPCPSSEQPPAPRRELGVGNPAHRKPPGVDPAQEGYQPPTPGRGGTVPAAEQAVGALYSQ